MKKFWKWKNKTLLNQETGAEETERILFLNGTIAEESWFDDDVTPALFKEELMQGSGNITVWINSPGGDCVAAAQIYNMLMDYRGDVTVKIDGIAASAASVIAMAGTNALGFDFESFGEVVKAVWYPPYGYENNDGAMEVIPAQAEIVKEIFCLFLEGKSTHVIARLLNDRGVKTKRDGKWSAGTVNGILKNEKYTGDVVFQKTWTDDAFTRHVNYGEADQYVIKNHHEAIVSKKDFDAVQTLLAKHFSEKGGEKGKGKYQQRYTLSGKIVCGECGTNLKRKIYKKISGSCVLRACNKHIEDKSSCSLKAVRQVTIEAAFITMMNKLVFAQDIMLEPLYMALESDARRSGIRKINRIQEKMEENTARRHQLRSMMTQGLLDADIFNDENNTLLSEYDDMEKSLYELKSEINSELIHIKELEKLMMFTNKREMLERYDDEPFVEYVDYLIAYSQTKIGFVLKCGLTLVEEVDV